MATAWTVVNKTAINQYRTTIYTELSNATSQDLESALGNYPIC
ncbi:hypothetical protein Vi05172_g7092 [Venturia inaequalis]|nr:hypothetical protein Vi05172_g7092 [Venturia inaequalis]